MGNVWTDNYVKDEVTADFEMEYLERDDCYLRIENKDYDTLYLYSKFSECIKCPFTYDSFLTKEYTLKLNTQFAKQYRLLSEKLSVSPENSTASIIGLPEFGMDYGEFGIYKVSLVNGIEEYRILKESVNIYFPIFTVFLIYLAFFLLVRFGYFLWKHLKFERLDLPFVSKVKSSTNSSRVQSLDTFRGMSIVLMIFINYGHGGYPFLEHAVWNGLCPGDLVFPSFLWIMGVCIPISIRSHFNKEDAKRWDAFKNVTKRSAKLFAIGMFLGSGPYLNTLRVFGVLQRFAISYFVVATVGIITYQKGNAAESITSLKRHYVDLLRLKIQWIVMLLVVMMHCVLTFCLEVPNCPTGYLGPGGLHEEGKYVNCTGGAAGYIDDLILGKHIYQHALITNIYKARPFDPEGILGCLTTIFHVFLGVQAGTIILAYQSHAQRLSRWVIWGVACGLIGGFLCDFSKDEGVIPVNKHLWSLSFVFATTSIAFFLLSMLYVLIDVWKYWTGKPLKYAGMNAILMYVGHSMTPSNFPIHWFLSYTAKTHFLSLIENVWATLFWVLVAYYLAKRKIFWTL